MSTVIRFVISAAIAAAAVVLPLHARAGGPPTTVHLLSINLKTVSQTTNSHGDDVADKVTAKQNDVFKQCVGASPAKDEGIYLFLDCADLNTNTIAAIDTDPLFDTAVIIGGVDFDLGHMVQKQKSGVTQSATVPVEIHLSCDGATTTADVSGIMSLTYSPLGGSPACPLSGKVQITGVGHNPTPGNFIVDSGSSVSVGKRSGSIVTFPPK
ncbi:MAG TPA: hypothetical protein VMR50_02025 [Myxococcota bacterium]|nr:hypothetical protein [Myxococcota bacterium]